MKSCRWALPNRIYAHCSSSKLSWKWRRTSVMLFLLRTNRHLHDFLEQHSFIFSLPTCVSSGIFSQNVVSWWICMYRPSGKCLPGHEQLTSSFKKNLCFNIAFGIFGLFWDNWAFLYLFKNETAMIEFIFQWINTFSRNYMHN